MNVTRHNRRQIIFKKNYLVFNNEKAPLTFYVHKFEQALSNLGFTAVMAQSPWHGVPREKALPVPICGPAAAAGPTDGTAFGEGAAPHRGPRVGTLRSFVVGLRWLRW